MTFACFHVNVCCFLIFCMFFCLKKNKPNFFPPNGNTIGDDIIERVFKSKFLGVTLDPFLKFSEFILNVVKKILNLFQ